MLKLDGIVSSMENHLNQFYKMRYYTSHCITSTELFRKFKKDKIKLSKKQYLKEYKADTRQELAAKVLNYCLYLVLLDIINNNIIFALPDTFGFDSEISMKTFQEDEFKEMWRRGKFRDIDFVLSRFRGHQIFYTFETKSGVKEKPIYVNKKLKDIISDNTNAGKNYF